MIQEMQNRLHEIVADAMETETADNQERIYQRSLGLVHSAIEDGKLERLYQALNFFFPEYFNNQDN